MESKELIQLKIDSIVIFHYISLYARLDKITHEIFINYLLKKDHIIRSKLYFYYGCTVGNKTYIDYDSRTIKMDSRKYKDDELFKELTFNQIIKIDKKEHIIDIFNCNIQSFINRTLNYPFHDCCIKIIKMRNKLAHELENLSFKNEDVIEVFSNKHVEMYAKEWLAGFDIRLMKSSTVEIYSNYIIMEKITKYMIESQKRG
jgi:hypothetical protein